jgi:hypothetical protein
VLCVNCIEFYHSFEGGVFHDEHSNTVSHDHVNVVEIKL